MYSKLPITIEKLQIQLKRKNLKEIFGVEIKGILNFGVVLEINALSFVTILTRLVSVCLFVEFLSIFTRKKM